MTNGRRSSESGIAIYLGLGSNVGNREANLREAIARIEALGVEVISESSIYETEPVGFTDQAWFLNQAVEARIVGGPTSERRLGLGDPDTAAIIQAKGLLSELLTIEHEMGRKRSITNGPRVIDIDLLLFGEMIIGHSKEDEEQPLIDPRGVIVPHPRMHMRRFVLEPLCEIAPDVLHPVLKTSCREMLASLDDDSRVSLFNRSRGQRGLVELEHIHRNE